jgi:hypothetical protein
LTRAWIFFLFPNERILNYYSVSVNQEEEEDEEKGWKKLGISFTNRNLKLYDRYGSWFFTV